MFTSSIKTKSFFNGECKVEVEFTDGTQKWSEPFSVKGQEDLNSKVKSRLQILNELETFSASLPLGAYTPTTTPEVPPTADEIARDAWLSDWAKLVSAQKVIDHGVTLTTQQQNAVTTIRNRIATNLKVEYLGLI